MEGEGHDLTAAIQRAETFPELLGSKLLLCPCSALTSREAIGRVLLPVGLISSA